MDATIAIRKPFVLWNKGRLVGQKVPLKLREIWAIRIRLQLSKRLRDLALFNLAIDSKLRGCDLVNLRVKDIAQGRNIFHRAISYAVEDATACSIRDHGRDPSVSSQLD